MVGNPIDDRDLWILFIVSGSFSTKFGNGGRTVQRPVPYVLVAVALPIADQGLEIFNTLLCTYISCVV